jgi:ribosomal protein S18 acetylase RimI-like enzyme
MNDTTQLKNLIPQLSIEHVGEQLSPSDLNDLCDATDEAIKGGGGFGWVELPAREMLERYWQGVVTAPTRELFVARLDGVICGTTQVVLPAGHNAAQEHMVQLTTNFIAPWARGHGLARKLLEEVEAWCVEENYAVINLDVRETMDAAIKLYEALGYEQFGLHPYAVRVDGKTLKSRFYYKVINPSLFE